MEPGTHARPTTAGPTTDGPTTDGPTTDGPTTEAGPHRWRIDRWEYERHESRRGRRFAYERLDPRRTVLVVVDMVPFFARDNPHVRGIVPNIDAIAQALRAARGTVAWVLPAAGPPSSHMTEFFGPRIATTYSASGGTGAMRDRLCAGLDGRDGDLWAEKSASSAFFPGRSTLPAMLADRDIDTVLVTGTVTSVCCESTARDASTLGYRVIMVADGTADTRDEPHNATLRVIYRTFGDVRPTTEVLALIAAGPGPGGTA